MVTKLSAVGALVVAILSVILPAIGDPAAVAALPFLVAAAPLLLLALFGRFLVPDDDDMAERGLNLSDSRSLS